MDEFGPAPADELAADPTPEDDTAAVPVTVDADDALLGTQPIQTLDVPLAPPVPEPEPSLVGRLLGRRRDQDHLYRLSGAIDRYPDSPSNYVLRGELYLKVGETALAEADFRQALSLAQADYETSRWGLVAQALQDRARAGLTKATGRR